jgi:hypothetical protein
MIEIINKCKNHLLPSLINRFPQNMTSLNKNQFILLIEEFNNEYSLSKDEIEILLLLFSKVVYDLF